MNFNKGFPKIKNTHFYNETAGAKNFSPLLTIFSYTKTDLGEKEKAYDKKYRQTNKKIILMEINFDSEKRNLGEWEVV